MRQIRVLLVDDHLLVRAGIRSLLMKEPDIDVAWETGDGLEAVKVAREHKPDVVVMDAHLPSQSGVEATRAIRKQSPNVEVIALTMHDSPDLVFGMLRAGARGYLLKDVAAPDLVNAIRMVSRGQSALHPLIAHLVIEEVTRAQQSSTIADGLTLREREIFELIAEGKTSREIGLELSLSMKTIDNYRAQIIQKLNAKNKAEAIMIGFQRGLLRSAPTVAM